MEISERGSDAAMDSPQPSSEEEEKGQFEELPFIEKYRPKSLSDVISHKSVIAAVSTMMTTGNFPHMVFYGPPGTGKTSTALVIAKVAYGDTAKFKV